MADRSNDPFVVAAVQAAPVFLDREATVEKACRLIKEAADSGAKLAVFPEGFIPTYPLWVWFIPAKETRALRDLYSALLENAVTIPGVATEQLCSTAREARIAVAIGVNEVNAEASGTSLYNTLLYIGTNGEIVGRHRKLVPTVGERLVHAQGDGSTLGTYDFDFARVSGLICWENYMPLARYVMWAWGAEIHLAPTWDRGEPWLSTLRHTAKEGRVYVVGCCSAMRRDDVPNGYAFKKEYLPSHLDWLNPGDSAIVNPDGKFVAGPVSKQEAILYGEVNPQELRGPRFQLDVAGHYGRPDIFELRVDRRPRPMIMSRDAVTEEPPDCNALPIVAEAE